MKRLIPPAALATGLLLGLVACLCAAPRAHAASDLAQLKRSVVRIVNYSQRGDWSTPWEATRVAESSGSGFVVEGGVVMTNAHVVSDSRLLLLLLHNDPQPYRAEVLHVAHDCDLALVRPLEPGVLEGVPPLEFGPLPELGTIVDTLGYPAGGIQVSNTRGVVSRIEQQLYVHSGVDLHLAVQTDAAINPGASGGPVVQDGKVVGVAFQTNFGLENAGFFIPGDVIDRFFGDVADGTYDGYPELGIEVEGLENPAARARYGMAPDETGVRVFRIQREDSADGLLEVGDVVLAIDDRPVANDGTVADRDSRVPLGMLVDRMQIGDSLTVRVLRDGERLPVEVPLRGNVVREYRSEIYDRGPRYVVYAGLVFTELDRELLKTYGQDWFSEAPKNLIREAFIRPAFEPELSVQPRVVLLRRMKHLVNSDMAWHRDEVVERVNGRPVPDLDALVAALDGNEGDHHVFEFSTGRRFGVLDRAAADAAHPEILELYGIPQERNP